MATTVAAMWVHGNTVVAQLPGGGQSALIPVSGPAEGSLYLEDNGPLQNVSGVPWTSVVGYRKGHGCYFRGKAGRTNDFYFSIPTPVLIPVFHPDRGSYEPTRVRLGAIYVISNRIPGNEETSVNTSQLIVNEIAVHDGIRRPLILNPESRAVTTNRWDLREATGSYPEVFYGLCISVRVQFLIETDIEFTAAGADFLLEVP
jgi:hypothetical protein